MKSFLNVTLAFLCIVICSCSEEQTEEATLNPAFATTSNNYTSYKVGSTNDKTTSPQGGVCLMGGATEDDNAMKWFLNRAKGGDVLVLRTSGDDGYNDYFYSDLGVNLNSVETIVFHNGNSSSDQNVLNKINKAEAIWFAGGDQWDYISFWRNTPVATAINNGINNRNIVIGGTSAGMAIQGKFYYTAQNGSVTSNEALRNPYDNYVTISNSTFIQNDYLTDVITDTHYDNPDRKGRHVTFLARMVKDYGIRAKGIACDEYTSVCIDEKGLATIYGGAPDYDDNAYFIQPNPEIENNVPEVCEDGEPLEWNKNNKALKVYSVKGTNDGNHTFNLNDWKTANGGEWQYWYVENGELKE
ncbi:cyanophycinase [Galbibacter mesophilus]|uniref:cyanophycinase n=1 Tax=Galbibacter mesophilus TaxID=379069 RepID=UPI00191F13B8|nr:Type 1 glutamine amidotransferase-like domain-containing protein [Galbibacter mesophilus]MCM5661434.1 Type 1 glutamine amidotransferase-like domain-containing protein [Galbibacter mesophilus]